jgi:hypothetical protein
MSSIAEWLPRGLIAHEPEAGTREAPDMMKGTRKTLSNMTIQGSERPL